MKILRLFVLLAFLSVSACETATDVVDTATDVAGDAANSVADAAGDVTDAVTDAAGDAVDHITDSDAEAAGDAMASNSMAAALASDFPRLSAALVEYAEAMPADKYGYKPTPEVDNFGEMLMHSAGAVMGVCGALSDAAAPEVNMEANTKEDIIAAIKTVYAHAAEVVGGLSDSELNDPVSLFGGAVETSKAGAIGIASNHSTHHKGGLVVYLRMNGITPPQFGGI